MSLTTLLIVSCIGASIGGWAQPALISVVGISPYHIRVRGEWYRLLTHPFFHADLQHLLFNLIAFYSFAEVIHRSLTPFQYACLLLLGLLGSSLLSIFMRPVTASQVSIGFSGIVSAVAFATIVFYPKIKLLVLFIPMPGWLFAGLYTVYSLYAARVSRDNIDHWAHLGGAAVGIAFAWLLIKSNLI